MTSFAYSCVVDDDPVLLAQAFIWLNCMLKLRSVRPSDVFVHTTEISNGEFNDWLVAQGVNVVPIEKFNDVSPHCNKIQQLQTFVSSRYDQVICMDCDTAWVGSRLPPVGKPVSASIVHYPNPPLEMLCDLFARAELGAPEFTPAWFPVEGGRQLTDSNNLNGGLYILDRSFLEVLEPRWRAWANWCIDNREVLDGAEFHLDQISFAMAMREIGAVVNHLDLVWNYPTNVRQELLPDLVPEIIHYHRELTPQLGLKSVGHRRVDAIIAAFNAHIAQFVGERLLNTLYWDCRYALHPDLGSGVGSRGDDLARKSQLLLAAIEDVPDAVVLDVGCGDLEVTRDLPISCYVGLDVSTKALEMASGKRPDWEFRLIEPGACLPESDIVLCLDVLIHQNSEGEFDTLLRRLAAATRRRLIVTAYDRAPCYVSEITRYYRPITQALRSIGCFERVNVVGECRDTVMIVAEKVVPSIEKPVHLSKYYDRDTIAKEVAAGEHRGTVGGEWDKIGMLQFEYLVAKALQPEHRLLDIGCGCLRGGVRFIRYLAPANYFGVDINQSLLDAGYNVELAQASLQDRLPRENLVCSGEFEFDKFKTKFDVAIAQSLFTHLPFNHIRHCLTNLAPVMEIGGVFFATFFELPRSSPITASFTHSPGDVTTHGDADPYHYWLSDMFYAAARLPWRIQIGGSWNHPRGQKMLLFTRIDEG